MKPKKTILLLFALAILVIESNAQNASKQDSLSPKLNPNTLRIGNFGFGSFNFTVPDNTTSYTNRLDVKDSLGVFVDVTAGLDIANNRAFWIFQSIDPATGLSSTLAANKGFLLVDDSITHRGEAYVTLTLQPLPSAKTRDTATEQASILFDNLDTIPTNAWKNTIDAVAPTSKVNKLPVIVDSVFSLAWTGKDDSLGVGVKSYSLYYSQDNGPFTLYQANIDSTKISFTGQQGSAYSFYTRAVDYTGNMEPDKTKPDAVTTIAGNGVGLAVKVFLQGPYVSSEGMMTDSLRAKSLLPASTPYTSSGYVDVNNTSSETVMAGVLDSTGTKGVTDWIWLELRSSSDSTKVVATRSALLKRDGNVVDMDGVSPVYFNNVQEGSYYIAVKHRNHLAVMSASPVAFTKLSTTSADFTSTSSATYGTGAENNINGVKVMWSGDSNGDGILSYNGANNDKNSILSVVGLKTPNNNVVGYLNADINLDGKVTYNGANNDKNKILANVGLLTPNNIIVQQLPK